MDFIQWSSDPKITKIVNILAVIGVIAVIPITVILVQKPQTLKQQAAVNELQCDLDYNGIVTKGDYQILIMCMNGKPSCTPSRRLNADFNHDDMVDETDLNLFLANCKIQ